MPHEKRLTLQHVPTTRPVGCADLQGVTSSLHITRYLHLDFFQVLTKKRMIASLFPTLLAKIFLIAVRLVTHAGVYHKHYG